MRPHTWAGITGHGYGSTHDSDGDYLYGYEVCVTPDARRLHIGRRLYRAREALCINRGLKGIVFGGRLPGMHRRFKQFGSAAAYVRAVQDQRIHDSGLSFQLAEGYQLLGIIPRYLPADIESMGYAAHLIWRHPGHTDRQYTSGDSYRYTAGFDPTCSRAMSIRRRALKARAASWPTPNRR